MSDQELRKQPSDEFRTVPCRLVAGWCRTHQRHQTDWCIDPSDLGFRIVRAAVGVDDALAVVQSLRVGGLSIQPIGNAPSTERES